jgi:RNA polymerase sigma-70 factor, ECF subfamily
MQDEVDQAVNWIELVSQIQSGSEAGVMGLYRIFWRGLRCFLLREIGPQDCDDRMHEILLIVLNAIRNNRMREPQCIMSFVWTVARRQVASTIQQRVVSRQRELGLETGVQIPEMGENPEMEVISRERIEIARKALLTLSPINREILARFYLKDQRQEQICREMRLTETQFRLGKSRAKARFAEAGKMLARKPAGKVFNRLEAARQIEAACA